MCIKKKLTRQEAEILWLDNRIHHLILNVLSSERLSKFDNHISCYARFYVSLKTWAKLIIKRLSSLIIQLILTKIFITCIPPLSLSPSSSTNDATTTPLLQTLHYFYHYNHNRPLLLHNSHLSTTAPPIQQPPSYPSSTTITTHLFTTTKLYAYSPMPHQTSLPIDKHHSTTTTSATTTTTA